MTRQQLIEMAIDFYINKTIREIESYERENKKGTLIFSIDSDQFTPEEKIIIGREVASFLRTMRKQGFEPDYTIEAEKKFDNVIPLNRYRKKRDGNL